MPDILQDSIMLNHSNEMPIMRNIAFPKENTKHNITMMSNYLYREKIKLYKYFKKLVMYNEESEKLDSSILL